MTFTGEGKKSTLPASTSNAGSAHASALIGSLSRDILLTILGFALGRGFGCARGDQFWIL